MEDFKTAFIFPGQGSQSKGMLAELIADYTIVRSTLEEASQILGYDLLSLIQVDSENQLNQTEFTQPALLASSYAIWRLWLDKRGNKPHLLAGHSLGEYTALLCAEAISFEDALLLVQKRGQWMQGAVRPGTGAMAAILGLEPSKIQHACETISSQNQGVVVAANFNNPQQTVISGHAEAVTLAMEAVKHLGAKRCVLLPVSVPSHSPLMSSAAEYLAEYLQTVSVVQPKIPVLHNFDVFCHDEPSKIKEVLVKQLVNPVRWVEIVEKMQAQGVQKCMECGPGQVLTGLVKKINKDLSCVSLEKAETLQAGIEESLCH